jgi:hypothetical protein
MTLTNDERRLIHLYYSDSVAGTAGTMRFALQYITDPVEHAAVRGLITKLDSMGEEGLEGIGLESGELYGG